MIKLTKEQILLLHAQLIETTGGSDGIRDMGLLKSALENPFQSYGGKIISKHAGKGSETLLWIG